MKEKISFFIVVLHACAVILTTYNIAIVFTLTYHHCPVYYWQEEKKNSKPSQSSESFHMIIYILLLYFGVKIMESQKKGRH